MTKFTVYFLALGFALTCAGSATGGSVGNIGQPTTAPALSAATPDHNQIVLMIDKDGKLWCGAGFWVPDAQLSSFASEYVQESMVVITPNNGPDFKTLVEAREKLRAVGIKNMMFAGACGG